VQTPAQRAPHRRPQGQPEIDAGSWAQSYADSGRAQPGQCRVPGNVVDKLAAAKTKLQAKLDAAPPRAKPPPSPP
jgi:hypothetical protein